MAESNKFDADDYVEPVPAVPSEDMNERMRGIRARYDRCSSLESSMREMAKEDFRFAWIKGCQWDENLSRRRGKRPKYEFNKLGQAIKTVINNNRQNTPSIKIRATREDAKDMADIRQGLIRNIEDQSHADSVYDWGSLYAITSGFGAWRVSARYADSESFDQELFIERIVNPLTSVWFDSAAKELNRSDAQFAFMETTIGWEEFNERWPDADYDSWQAASQLPTGPGWVDAKQVRICEYWYKTIEEEEIYQLSDGSVVRAEEWDKLQPQEQANDAAVQNALSQPPAQPDPAAPAQPQQPAPNAPDGAQAPPAMPPGQPAQPPAPPTTGTILGQPVPAQPPRTIVKKRTVKAQKVKSEIVSGCEVLEGPFDWPGKYIPIIPVWGNIVNDDGKDEWFGMVRWATDPQRLYNYNRSNGVEIMAKQSTAPYLYTPAQIAGFESEWANMAVDNAPGLPYNPDPQAGGRPAREPPPQFPAGMLQAAQIDDNDIKATTGIWQASLGEPSNETSGRAIQNRAKMGNTATFDYQDNIARAVEWTGVVIDDLMPYYYDTYREIRILGADGAEKYIEVNKPVWNQQTQEWDTVNDLTKGKYTVAVTVGPSYATQRMETLDAMLQMAQSGGPAALLFQYGAMVNMDVPGMEEVTEAVRMMLVHQGILQPDADEPQPAPAQPNPAQQAQMAKAQTDAQKNQALAGKAQADAALAQAKTERTQIESHIMSAKAPADVAASHAALAAVSAQSAVAQSDAAWKIAHQEMRDDRFNNAPLQDLGNQQTFNNGGL